MSAAIPAPPAVPSARALSRSLSGYLCGTHSGVLGRRIGGRLDAQEIGRAPLAFAATSPVERVRLGERPWDPPAGAVQLRQALREALDVPEVVDLILYGSQARRSTTGYSDVDAILVVSDGAAGDPTRLRKLRPRILRAQRRVLEYQPMQHHGFEVATPTLLNEARGTLDLPREALLGTAALFGRDVTASFVPGTASEARVRFDRMADQLAGVRGWPPHPWHLHRLLSMFELVPALFLQASGELVEKCLSYEIASQQFPGEWRPYHTLRSVRERWPNRSYATQRALLLASRNPWAGMKVWRRVPIVADSEIRAMLTPATLNELQRLIRRMRATVGG